MLHTYMIVWLVVGAITLLFLSSAGGYFFVARKDIGENRKLYDGTFMVVCVCLAMICLSLGAWQMSKGSKSSTNNLNAI